MQTQQSLSQNINTSLQIKECILNVDLICKNMYLTHKDIKKYNLSSESHILGDIIKYQYIQLCCIKDEINILHRIAKNDIYLRDTLYVISPALRSLKKYNGIRKARNQMLAHYNRDENKTFKPWWTSLKGLKIPRTFNEFNQIFNWLHVINSILVTRYYSELKEISEMSKIGVENYNNYIVNKEMNTLKKPISFDNIVHQVLAKMKEKSISDKWIFDPMMTELHNLLLKHNKSKATISKS